MPKGQTKSTDAIQGLLQEKERIEAWLQRLTTAADETPAHVRAKVEQDYRARLSDVMSELQGHREELETAYNRLAEERAQMAGEETAESERLAEAELRHSVGEYDETTWNGLKSEILESLGKIRESLQNLDVEIAGLDGVLGLLRAPQPNGAATPVEAGPEPAAEPAAPPVSVPPPPDPGQPVPQTDPMDDTSVLRLETEDSQVPVVSEARGEFQVPADGSAPQTGRLTEEQAEAVAKADQVSFGIGRADEGIHSIEGDGSAPSMSTAKTLLCEECGTPNLPTEWYCERCGAELEAV